MSDFVFGVYALTFGLPGLALFIALGRGKWGTVAASLAALAAGVFVAPIIGILFGFALCIVAGTGRSAADKANDERRHAEMLAAIASANAPVNPVVAATAARRAKLTATRDERGNLFA